MPGHGYPTGETATARSATAEGDFCPAAAAGPGNPDGRRYARFRRLVAEAVTEDDLQEIVTTLVQLAKSGDLRAIEMVLDRCCGRPPTFEATELLPRLDLIEHHLAGGRRR